MPRPTIAVSDETVRHANWSPGVERLVGALQRYVDDCFAPIWGTPCEVVAGARPGAWPLRLVDHATRAGRIGFHDLGDDGLPFGEVSVGTVLRRGKQVSAIASHEVAEMLTNPSTNLVVPAYEGVFFALECCDPVEEESFIVDGALVSDFVLPAWFRRSPSARFDYLGRTRRPFHVLPRGHIPVLANGRWSERTREHDYDRRSALW